MNNQKVNSSYLDMLFQKFEENDELTVVDDKYEYKIKRKRR